MMFNKKMSLLRRIFHHFPKPLSTKILSMDPDYLTSE